jgi:dienelactone hydrolase
MASEWVRILIDGQDVGTYVSDPQTLGKVPHILMIMEAFGIKKHIQVVADKLWKTGDAAIAPRLYHRRGAKPLLSQTGDDAEARQQAMGTLIGAPK